MIKIYYSETYEAYVLEVDGTEIESSEDIKYLSDLATQYEQATFTQVDSLSDHGKLIGRPRSEASSLNIQTND